MKSLLSRLLTIVLLSTIGQAWAADVGRVLLAAGDTVAVRDKEIVKLVLGSAVQDQDLLRTGPASNLQVRFTDESILSMRESSEIRIDEFRFTGKEDGTERAFFSLLKGGLRKVTGLIGRTNHKNYQMGSIVATIGIRGTDYAATLCQQDCRNSDGTLAPDGLYGRVIGASSGTNQNTVTNKTGEHLFGISQNYRVLDAGSVPQLELERRGFVSVAVTSKTTKPSGGTGTEEAAAGGAQQDARVTPDAPVVVLPRILAGESSTTGGSPDPVTSATTGTGVPVTSATTGTGVPVTTGVPVVPSVAANGYVVAYPLPPFAPLGDVVADDDRMPPGVFNSLNQLIAYGTPGTFPAGALNGGSITDTGSLMLSNGQVITWGRWTGNTRITLDDGSTFTGAPVLFGTATGVTVGTVIGSLGGMATYSYAGGPKPVDAGGNVGNITTNIATINFTAQTAFLHLGIDFPSIVASGVNTGRATFDVMGTGFRVQNGHALDLEGLLSGTCTGTGCFLPGFASGFFDVGVTGPNGYDFAVFAGVITETQAGDVAFLNGYLASSFTSGAAPAAPAAPIALQFVFTNSPSTIGTGSQGASPTFTFSPPLLTSYNTPSPSGPQSGSLNTGTVVESTPAASATVQANAAAAGNIQWGRWTGAFQVVNGGQTLTPGSGLHYIYGDIAGMLPTSGSAIYNYIGGTNPTNSSGQVGTFSGGAFNVNFVTRVLTVSTPLTFTMPGGLSYSLNTCTSCTYPSPQASFINMGATLSGLCTGGGCSTGSTASGNLNGGFTGTTGQGLITSSAVSVTGATTPPPVVTFTSAFKR